MQIFDITDFGAVGDGKTVNTHACKAAAEACRAAGGGTLRIPSGVFLTGLFQIFSRTTLLVEKGGCLRGTPTMDDKYVNGQVGGLLYAFDAEDITLTGEGTLDGNGSGFFLPGEVTVQNEKFDASATWQEQNGLPYGSRETKHGPLHSHRRPGNMLVFARCRNVLFENLYVTGPAYWTTHFAECDGVLARRLHINNSALHPNNDGIHFTTCHNVRVENCRIFTGDDCIAITGVDQPGSDPNIALALRENSVVSENFVITDCVFSSRSAGVRIGFWRHPIRNVVLRNLTIESSNRGIGIFARQANVENVRIESCRIRTGIYHGNWWGRGEPIQISSVRYAAGDPLACVRNVEIVDVDCAGENAVTLFAEEPGAIENVKFIRVSNTVHRGELFEMWGGNLDLRPAADPKIAIHAGGLAPLYAIGVKGLRMEGCQWAVEPGSEATFTREPIIRDRT